MTSTDPKKHPDSNGKRGDPAYPFSIGSIIEEKWILIEEIGRGAMGVVYRAHQLNLKRDVAIKLISEDMLQDLEEDPREVENAFSRFQREVQTMARVHHANVLQIYDYGSILVEHEGPEPMPVEYISMEFIPGDTLRYTMSEDGFGDEPDLLAHWLRRYFLPLLDGVGAIHSHDVVHRDLKPENVLMDDEIPKIADFGLARSVRNRGISNSWDIKGTLLYMAPEQFSDFRKSGREADVYALGKILYEAVEGKMPPNTLPFKLARIEDPEGPLLQRIDGIIQRATAEEKSERYATVDALRRDLLELLKELDDAKNAAKAPPAPPPASGLRNLWLAGAALVAVLLILVIAGLHLMEMLTDDNAPLVRPPQRPPQSVTEIGKENLKPSYFSVEGREMQLIRGNGEAAPFYTDPSLVTIHHYAEFLNAVADSVEVSEGVVKMDDQIWIYLGDGDSPADQILYRHNRFHLRDASWAPKPVVRVTWQGARAYASYYGKRLPSYTQWQAILRRHPEYMERPSQVMETAPTPASGYHMMSPPIPREKGENEAETDGTEAVAKEWLTDFPPLEEGPDAPDVLIHVIEWPKGINIPKPVRRYAWEAFEDVGFRTVIYAGKAMAEE